MKRQATEPPLVVKGWTQAKAEGKRLRRAADKAGAS